MPGGPRAVKTMYHGLSEVESCEDQGSCAEKGVRAGGSSRAALRGRSTQQQAYRVQKTRENGSQRGTHGAAEVEELLPDAAGELCELAPAPEEAAGAVLDAAGALPEPVELGAADESPADEVGPEAGVEVSVTP